MNKASVTIRPATPSDAIRRNRIHYSSVHGLAAKSYSLEQVDGWSRRRLPDPAKHLGNQISLGDAILIAELDGRRVGFAELSGDSVRAVYVRAGFDRRGVGRALLEALEHEAIRRGICELHLESSINALTFYESQGYVCSERKMHRFASGVEIECAAMSKRLNAEESAG